MKSPSPSDKPPARERGSASILRTKCRSMNAFVCASRSAGFVEYAIASWMKCSSAAALRRSKQREQRFKPGEQHDSSGLQFKA